MENKLKKGFSLVELIAVIGVMALLLIIVAPIVSNSSANSKKKIYETKISMIEDAAVIYGQENYRHIVDCANACTNSDNSYVDCNLDCGSNYKELTESGITYRTVVINVSDLLPDYYTADSQDGTSVEDPRDKSKTLDEYEILIKINKNTRKVTAEVCQEDGVSKNCY